MIAHGARAYFEFKMDHKVKSNFRYSSAKLSLCSLLSSGFFRVLFFRSNFFCFAKYVFSFASFLFVVFLGIV